MKNSHSESGSREIFLSPGIDPEGVPAAEAAVDVEGTSPFFNLQWRRAVLLVDFPVSARGIMDLGQPEGLLWCPRAKDR